MRMWKEGEREGDVGLGVVCRKPSHEVELMSHLRMLIGRSEDTPSTLRLAI